MSKGGGWDETDSSHRYRVRDPSDFQEGTFRTIDVGTSGVQAVIGKLPDQETTTIQSLIFSKDEFELDHAKDWIEENPQAIGKRDFLFKADKQRYTLGIVYEPDTIDSQGDFATAEEIEKACHNFMRNLQRNQVQKGALGSMHNDWSDELGDIVECYIAPIDMEINGEPIKKGSWLLGAIWSEDMFQKVEKGEITGYSMGGTGVRETVHPLDGPMPSVFQKSLAAAIEARGGKTKFMKALKEVRVCQKN